MCFGVFPRTRQYVTVFSVTNNHDLLLIDIRLLVFDWFTISYPQIQVIPMKTRPQWSIKPHVLILINYILRSPIAITIFVYVNRIGYKTTYSYTKWL